MEKPYLIFWGGVGWELTVAILDCFVGVECGENGSY